jgi:tRNA-uridine 2-sulfurtransferase
VKVLCAMSGGVDSSVAALLLTEAGHDVAGVTLKLWGGESDTGCCAVSDTDDARRVAHRLGIDHHVFNFGDEFDASVVGPYLDAHRVGLTPNPCVECNRHIKFDKLTRRAAALGFDAVATGHHVRRVRAPDGTWRVGRGADAAKDQSYVLHMLDQQQLARVLLPLGVMTKADVRAHAARLGLRTAAKPDSQDVCFITRDGGRAAFLADRVELHPGRVVDEDGREVGRTDAVELVTVGQRRGLELAGGGGRRFAVDVDVASATVTVGPPERLLSDGVRLAAVVWADGPVSGPVLAQCSAHGEAQAATVEPVGDDGAELRWDTPRRRVAVGQSVVLYRGDTVVGGGPAR